MAKFKVIKACVDTVPSTARANANMHYVRLTVKSVDDFFSRARMILFFDKEITDAFLGLCSDAAVKAAVNGSVTVDGELPEEMSTIFGISQVVDMPKPFIMHYMNDLKDGAGVEHKKGDVIMNSNGTPRVYTSIEVFARQYFDHELGKYLFADRQDPKVLAQQRFDSQCSYLENGGAIATDDDKAIDGVNPLNNPKPEAPKPQPANNQFQR